MKTILSFFSVHLLLLCTTSLWAQNPKNMALEIRTGLNTSNAGYGIEALSSLLPINDYPRYSSTETPAIGFNFGVGASFKIGDHFEFLTNIDYIKYNYSVTDHVFDILESLPSNRVIRPDVPILITGQIGYHYLNIETGVRYSFNADQQKGMFIGLYISDMIHLNTNWIFDVKYEDQRIDNDLDLSEEQEGIEFRNVVFLGSNLGYQIKLKENFTISPLVDFRYGLNPVVEVSERENEPWALSFMAQAKWWF